MAEAAVIERPATIDRFYCHSCTKEVTPDLPDYTCPQCDDGFVEQIREEENVLHSPSEDNDSDSNPDFHAMRTMRNIMEQIVVPSLLDDGSNSNSVTHSDGTPTLISIQQNNNPRSVMMIERGPQSQRNVQMHGLVNYFLSQLTQMDPGIPPLAGGGMFQLHGSPGDYAWGANGLDSIISQLLNQLEGSGAPPAPEEKIANLPLVKINQVQIDKNIQCSVCMEDYMLDEEAHRLPCEHHYHPPCIIPWLKLHGTCPVCRKDLNGEEVPVKDGYSEEDSPF